MKRRAFEHFGYDPSFYRTDHMSVFSALALLTVVLACLVAG